MPLSDDELAAALADETSPNEPERLAGRGLSGPRDRVDPEVGRRKRALREAMSTLLASGIPADQIVDAFERSESLRQYGLDEAATRALMREVWASWEEEDAERKPHAKSAATRRILGHIQQAAKGKAYQAVAMLEKQLAEIEGTNEPKHIRLESESRLSVAILQVLGEMDPIEVRRLVAEEGARALTAGSAVVMPAMERAHAAVQAMPADRKPTAP